MKREFEYVPVRYASSWIGAMLLLALWIGVKYGANVSDRYLPGPIKVISAVRDLEPSVVVHTAATSVRLLVGLIFGLIVGIGAAILLYSTPILDRLLMPSVQSLRSVPPIATVPFFLVWFGFSETGKLLLVLLGVGLNILVAAHQILIELPDKYIVAMLSFEHTAREYPIKVCLPAILQDLLPAIRTSLSVTFGVVIVSELLGSQVGLGYLIQTSRATYSMHVIFLVAFILGVLNVVLDRALVRLWSLLIFWKPA
jgi:ABC-type nitrate/sulfonate/bicarbonate transport system permease component